MALRSRRHLSQIRQEISSGWLTSSTVLFPSLIMHIVLLGLALAAANEQGFEVWGLQNLDWRDVAITGVGLAAALSLLPLARLMHSIEERREMIVHYLAPRTRSERLLGWCVILVASVSEEVAFRRVGVLLVSAWTGSFGLAVVACALTFAVTHAVQGWKSGIIVLVIAMIFQAIASTSGTLLTAIVTHALLDFVALAFIGYEARRLGVLDAPAESLHRSSGSEDLS